MGQVMEKVKVYWGKVKEFLKKVPKKVFVLSAIALVLVVGIVIFVQVSQPYSVLFTGLNSDETAAIISCLAEQGATNYKLENNDTILVPKSQENTLKAKLLMEGYPKNGFSYSTYYDHVGALSTESERNTAYLLTLQERMGAVIRCFDNVKDAVVNITPGEDKSYVLDPDGKIETTASVFVTMNSGQVLSDQQAEAVRTLVAHAVQGLEINSVAISDNHGNTYTEVSAGDNAQDASSLKLGLEQKYNNLIRTNVMQVLAPLFGEKNVKVGVTCNVVVDRTIQDNKDFIPPENAVIDDDGIKGIIGSKVYENYVVRGGDTSTGGVPGTGSNSDFPTYVEDPEGDNGDVTQGKQEGQIDYDNSEHNTHIERVAGYLSDCMVSVSINSTAAGALDTTRMQNLVSHVARAAGITNDMATNKISLYSAPFFVEGGGNDPYPTGPVNPLLGWPLWVYAVAAGAIALLFFLIFLFLIFGRKKRRKRKKIETFRQPEAVEMLIPEPTGADIMTLQSDRNMELRKDIRKFADDNPEIAAQMVRTLLRGGEADA